MELYILVSVALLCVLVVVFGFLALKRRAGAPDLSVVDRLKDAEVALAQREALLEERSVQLQQACGVRDELQALTVDLNREVAALREALRLKEEALAQKEEEMGRRLGEMADLQGRMSAQFGEMASKIVEEKSRKFDEHSALSLQPLEQELRRLQQVVSDTYEKGLRDQGDLKVELNRLAQLNSTLQAEANNLTTALKGDSKVQGCYGEMLLERVLELSGLEKGVAYRTQENFPLGNGRSLQPDAVVYLTDGRTVVVDSKVSLTAYERYVSATESEEREMALKAHVDSMRQHVKELADKDYAHRLGLTTPEYVMMFVPIESSFGVALRAESSLYEYAWERKVVIVTPSTLLATLATVSQMWRQERQAKNAQEIARKAGSLYDKMYLLVEELETVGKKLDDAQDHLFTARKRLSEGNGNVLKQMEDLKTMGAKATKSLAPFVGEE